MDPMFELELVAQKILECTLCPLSRGRGLAVPGEGSQSAEIVLVGEGPGFYEDRDGRPFVGPAGKLLDQLLRSINLNRQDVYITNMVKCRPPNNRDPLPEEIEACRPYLDKQLSIINPKILVTLGKYSFSKFFPTEQISKARGKPRKHNGLIIYPTYHPAAALRNSNFRSAIERDFSQIPLLLNKNLAVQEQSDGIEEKPYQLGLFQS